MLKTMNLLAALIVTFSFLLASPAKSQGLVEIKNIFGMSPPISCTGETCDVTLSVVNRGDTVSSLDDFRIFIEPDLPKNKFTYTPDTKAPLNRTELVCTQSLKILEIPPHVTGSLKIQIPGGHIVYARVKDAPVGDDNAPSTLQPLLCWDITNSITGDLIAHSCKEMTSNGFVAPVVTDAKGPLCDLYAAGDCTCP